MKISTQLLGCLVFCALLLCGCASTPTVQSLPHGVALPPPSAAPAQTSPQDSHYRIGAQDVLDISVFGVPDLSRTIRVNGGGGISVPLIGTVQAAGKTVPQLETLIGSKLEEKYLQNAQVSVFIKEFASQRVTLEGSLREPGIYPLRGDTTLLQAIALAGGMSPLASTDDVVVFREIQGRRMAAVFNLGKIATGHADDPQIFAGDIIVVHQSGSKSAIQNIIQATPLLGLFFLL